MDGNISHSDAFVKRLIELVEINLHNEHYDVETLAKDIGLSRSRIHRRLRSETGQSTSQFIREIRLQRAHELLQDGVGTAAEIAYKVGFSSPTYFNKCFHEFYGYTPGKLAKTRKNKGKFFSFYRLKLASSFAGRLFWVTAASLIVIVLGLWLFNFHIQAQLLSEDSRQNWVAVIPFTNHTNDPELDMLGHMAADWITGGLKNFDNIKVVPYQAVRDNMKFTVLNDPQIRATFAARTEANKAITGNYYLSNDEIVFHAQLVDIATNEVEQVLPIVRGEKFEIEALINDINQRVMSIFGIDLENDSLLIQRCPPNFRAYQCYLKGLDFLWIDLEQSTKYLKEAIRQDSTFLPPYLILADEYESHVRVKEKDSVMQVIEARFKYLTPLEQAQVDVHKAKTLDERYEAMKSYHAKDPKHYFTNYWLPGWAGAINKPYESLELSKKSEERNIAFPNKRWKWYWKMTRYLNLTRLGRYDEAIADLETLPIQERKKYLYLNIFNYVITGQPAQVDSLIKEMESAGESRNLINKVYLYTAECYRFRGDSKERYRWAQKGIDKIKTSAIEGNTNNWQLAWAYYDSRDYENAIMLYEDFQRRQPRNQYTLHMLGICYAESGMSNEAQEVITRLDTVQNDFWSVEKYFIARIYTALDEKEKAVDYLKQAYRGNFGFDIKKHVLDPYLQPLHGYPPYEEFIKPRG